MSEFCLGLDEEGCLFCHQYPGMVRLEHKDVISGEPAGKLKILHIDEQDFLNSAHGKVSCKKCHTTINSVPHTGESQVDCTTFCHEKEEEKKKIEDYPLIGFHEKEQAYVLSLDDDHSSCEVCHDIYPHSNNQIVRAFLNMHTGFMRCEVCHINKTKINNIVFEWKESNNAQFFGKPFGTHYNPRTKEIQKNKHYISRISAFSVNAGEKIDLTNSIDIQKAEIFMHQEKKMTPADLEQALLFFHRDIEKKEVSLACDQCHTVNGTLDLKGLGFDQKKIKNLTTINIKGLVVKYKTFYFPNLFGL